MPLDLPKASLSSATSSPQTLTADLLITQSEVRRAPDCLNYHKDELYPNVLNALSRHVARCTCPGVKPLPSNKIGSWHRATVNQATNKLTAVQAH